MNAMREGTMRLSTVRLWLAILATIAFALLNGYGWWFHFSVGPAHGAGAEIGILGGVLAVGSGALAIWFDKRRGS